MRSVTRPLRLPGARFRPVFSAERGSGSEGLSLSFRALRLVGEGQEPGVLASAGIKPRVNRDRQDAPVAERQLCSRIAQGAPAMPSDEEAKSVAYSSGPSVGGPSQSLSIHRCRTARHPQARTPCHCFGNTSAILSPLRPLRATRGRLRRPSPTVSGVRPPERIKDNRGLLCLFRHPWRDG